jgi:nucleotide-binding universal stress UspA family protein
MTGELADNRIVVGVDGSAASAAAVRWAVREARLRHATIHLICAHHSDYRLRAPYASRSWLKRQNERHAAARETLAAMAAIALRHLPPDRVISELVDEAPVRALLNRAAGAEMLVLGANKAVPEPGKPPLALGPVARDCLRLARCPVVAVDPDGQLPGDLASSALAPTTR